MTNSPISSFFFTLPDEAATARLAATLAVVSRPRDVLALRGTLGAGKTSFARAFVRSLTKTDEDVPSPTFTLVQTYRTPLAPIWHFDLYRLQDPDEIWELDFEDAMIDGIMLIEWPDLMGTFLPKARVELEISPGEHPQQRRVILQAIGSSDWLTRANLENFR